LTALIDSHLHFWDPEARRYEWLDALPALRKRFGPDDVDPGRHELGGVVFVQADARDDEALDEVHWVQSLALENEIVRGIVAYAPVHLGAAATPNLDALAGEPLVVGVRRLLQGRPVDEIVSPPLLAGVRLLAAYGLTFDVCVTHDQLPAVAQLVSACPETTLVVDHLGKPPVATGELDPWRADLARVAAAPNTLCKLSGLATEAAPGWSDADVRPYLAHALDSFGPERCMLGSDWPVATQQTTMERWFDIVLDLVSTLNAQEQDAVLGETASRSYGLSTSARHPLPRT
jgi:predicted TIM-barrel fold metal-dependent hydrolase